MTKLKRQKSLLCLLLIFIITFTLLFTETQDVSGASYTGKYWLKVNAQQNVVTAYKKVDGQWTPIRAMLCSVGLNDTTPLGTFYTQGKWRWGELMNDVYGQYCTHITGEVLFHSVYYMEANEKDSQATSQFNLLGYAASHGCVRLSVMDARWIYNTCKTGTRVTIYKSSNPGPLGKPEGITVYTGRAQYWDPTDPDPDNPYYLLKDPVITISSKKNLDVQYASTYNLKSYVYAKDPNTFMNLRSRLTVSKVQRYVPSKKKYVTTTFSTKQIGTYKITYTVDDPYSGKASKTIKLKVSDNANAPVISGAKNRTVTWGDTDATGGVTAAQASGDRTSAMQVYIKAPGASKYRIYTYAQAQSYKFTKTGKYQIKYRVKNKYSPYKIARKVITVTSKKGNVNEAPVLTIPEDKTVYAYAGGAFEGVSATHNGVDVTENITVSIKGPEETVYTSYSQEAAAAYVFTEAGEYKIKYKIKNTYTPYQTVTKILTITIL